MSRSLLILVAMLACACSQGAPRTPDLVLQDVRRFTMKAQQRSDESAKICHRATSAAAVAAANVLGPLTRHEAVLAERYKQLQDADRAMQSACAPFR
jgi:hypothetical protein